MAAIFMAAILVFCTDFQVAPPLESYLLASTNTTESGTFQSKSAAFSGVPDVLLLRYPCDVTLQLRSNIKLHAHVVHRCLESGLRETAHNKFQITTNCNTNHSK